MWRCPPAPALFVAESGTGEFTTLRLLGITVIAGSCLLSWQIHEDRQRQNDDILRQLLGQQHDEQAEQLAKQKATEYAERQFDEKFNTHAEAMNAIAEDRRKGIANLKRFELAAKSWQKLYDDPGFLKRKQK